MSDCLGVESWTAGRDGMARSEIWDAVEPTMEPFTHVDLDSSKD